MKKNRPTWWALLVLGLAGAAGLASTSGTYVEAADHLDPPARTNPMATPPGTDRTADIADVYAWAEDGRTTVIMSFGGPNAAAADQDVVCDEDVLYQIHIDTDTMPTEFADDFTINVRLGEDDLGNCFYRIDGVPSTATGEVISGPVGYQTNFGEVNAIVGLFDDAFFFDLEGFRAVTTMGTLFNTATPEDDLLFVNDRDFFALQNTPAIVLEFPTAPVSSGDVVRVWGSTGRITP